MPTHRSVRGFSSSYHRLLLTLAGLLAAIVGTGIAIYWGHSQLNLSSIRPSDPSADSDSHANPLKAVSPTQPTAVDVSASTANLTVPQVDLKYTLTGALSSFHSLAISPDGKTLVSSSDYSNVKVWDLSKGCPGKECSTPTRILPMYSHQAYGVAMTPDGQWIATGSWKDIKIWNLNTGQLARTISGHLGSVYTVAIAPNSQRLASGSSDDKVRIWDLNTGKLLHTLSAHSDSVRSLAISPDGKILASGGLDKAIILWNLDSNCTGEHCKTPTHILSGHTEFVSSLAMMPDGQRLVSGSADQTIKIWNLQTGRLIQTLVGHEGTVLSVAVSPDGMMLASGSADGTIKLWWLKTGEPVKTLSGHQDMVNSVAFSPDGRTLVSGSKDKTIKVWQLQ